MKKNNNIKKGFTLVELLVVISILAVLAVVTVVGYTSFTKKAKISNDIGLTTQLNTILQANETTDGANKYPHEAAQELVDGGYDVTKITPTTEKYNYVYDLSQNRMFLLDESYNVVAPSDLTLSDDKVSVFGFAGSQSDVTEFNKHGYSVYLKSTYNSDSVTTSKGVDVGENRITTLNYTNTTDGAQQVIIRTISASTNLTVNAPSDTIKHYGTAGSITLTKVSTSSFWEYGKAAFVELTEGRIVLTEDSDVEIINVTKKDETTYYNPIIADGGVKSENMPSMISRDAITSSTEATALVQIQKLDASGKVTGATEQVYTKGSSNTKTDVTDNTSVSSVLGNIAIDTTAGDKSLTDDKKTEEKTNAVMQAESSESPKVEPVSNGIVYNSKSNKYYTETDPTKYETVLNTAISEANAGDTLYLFTDITTTGIIAIEKSIILDGQGYTITNNSNNSKTIINITEILNGVVTVRNLKLVADKQQYTGVRVDNINNGQTGTNFTLNMNDLTIDVDNKSNRDADGNLCNGGYAIMIRGTAKDIKVNLNNVIAKGWVPIQSTSDGVKLVANNCTFNSINQLDTKSGWNNCSAIIVSDYYLFTEDENGISANNNFTFNKCEFTATYTGSNKQKIADIRSPYDNVINFNGCKFTYNDPYYIWVCYRSTYSDGSDPNYDGHSKVYVDGKDVTNIDTDHILIYID